ncbi:MAG: lipoyl domain-containing protein [Thaumarchaeota archaeon]|nr:lipoyl domain-containing protein [Nitrososphaerota archaeon]
MTDVEVLLPKADPSVTEGKIMEWSKKEGEKVEVGDTLVMIETEKVEYPVEAAVAGTLKKTLAKPGDTVAVNQVIAIIETQ